MNKILEEFNKLKNERNQFINETITYIKLKYGQESYSDAYYEGLQYA